MSLGLLVGILLALNYMAGGRHSTIVRPAIRMAENLLTVSIRIVTTVLGSVFKLGAGSVKLPKSMESREHKPPGSPPPRWKDK